MPLSPQEDRLRKDQLSLPFQYEERDWACQPQSPPVALAESWRLTDSWKARLKSLVCKDLAALLDTVPARVL